MAKWKAVPFEELARLTRSQLVTMAMGQLKERKRKELYEAAKHDAEEAEAYAEELEAKLAKALEFIGRVVRYAGNNGDDFIADKARTALAELKGQDDE